MPDLSPHQFPGPDEAERAAGGVPLPGMEKRSPFAQQAGWQVDKENAEYRAHRQIRDARASAAGPVMDRWSGPDPHQTVMGVHDLADNNGQMDAHGFVSERPFVNRGELDPVHLGKVRTADENHLGQGGNGVPAKNFYHRYGGSKANRPEVQMHWAAQPVVQVRSDQLIHTGQSTDETELGRAHGSAEFQALFPGRREGRERVNNIRDDVEQGNPIEKPAWLIKHNSRLYSLDGHHRIVAAREAGLSHFPARLWDLDAQRKAGGPDPTTTPLPSV